MTKYLTEKNAKLIVVIALIVFLIAFIQNPAMLGIVPGPEGPDTMLHGIEVDNSVSVTSLAHPNDLLSQFTDGDYTSWIRWQRPDPKTPSITYTHNLNSDGLALTTRIRRPQVSELDTHGNPAGTSSPSTIQYYSFNTNFQQTSSQATWSHYEAYMVPVDFVIELSVRPTANNIQGSEMAFTNLNLWFVLDTNVWLNAFSSEEEVQNAMASGLYGEVTPTGATVTAYDYKGAFPIWAWVGGWDPFVLSGRDGSANKDYSREDISPSEWNAINNMVQIIPSYAGSEVTLYTSAGYGNEQQLYTSDLIKNPALLKEKLSQTINGLPDPRFAVTVYFPLTLQKFGALHQVTGAYPLWGTEKWFYPTAYMRVRALYVVWGEWNYLWTVQEAQNQGYVWENRSSTIIAQTGLLDQFLSGLGGLLSGLTSSWQFWLIIIVIILVLITVLNPGFWSMLMYRGKKI